jgi:hypothetical protein
MPRDFVPCLYYERLNLSPQLLGSNLGGDSGTETEASS